MPAMDSKLWLDAYSGLGLPSLETVQKMHPDTFDMMSLRVLLLLVPCLALSMVETADLACRDSTVPHLAGHQGRVLPAAPTGLAYHHWPSSSAAHHPLPALHSSLCQVRPVVI